MGGGGGYGVGVPVGLPGGLPPPPPRVFPQLDSGSSPDGVEARPGLEWGRGPLQRCKESLAIIDTS
jgi:hypothetical protein